MSYSIVTGPEAYNLTSMFRCLEIDSDEDLLIKIIIGTDVILEETYTPDSDEKVYVRDLGRVFSNYVSGSGFDSETQSNIVTSFKININGDDYASGATFPVMYCNAISRINPENYFLGNAFLHNMKPVKRVTPDSKEYKSVFLTAANSRKVEVFLTVFDGTTYENTDKVTLSESPTDVIRRIDVSFEQIKLFFPGVDPDTIVAYRLVLPSEIAVYMIDREKYLFPLQFRFRNIFDCPETIMTRGDVIRKGISTFEKSRIGFVDKKYNIERSDEFLVSSGKIYTQHDYDRYAELFNSEDVEVLFSGAWKKVIVSEEDSSNTIRMGSLMNKTFKFTFADPKDNNMILGESFFRWILSGGTWIDGDMWIDEGQWIDDPE